jgi:hypothetical protein
MWFRSVTNEAKIHYAYPHATVWGLILNLSFYNSPATRQGLVPLFLHFVAPA